jgi:hypothetical protein
MTDRKVDKMKKAIIGLVLLGLLAASIAYAMTDYNCMRDCQAKGYSYYYCKSQCSY